MSQRIVTNPVFLIPLRIGLGAVAAWTIRAYTQGLPPFQSHAQVALPEEPDALTPRAELPPTEPLHDAPEGPPEEEGAPPEQDAARSDDGAEDGWVDVSELEASGPISEEHYIQISVRFVIAAIGFQNAGQGNEELAEYLPELLEKEGVTLAAFEKATDQISSDPEQAERVADEIVKRVQLAAGVQMDVNLLPMFGAPASSD